MQTSSSFIHPKSNTPTASYIAHSIVSPLLSAIIHFRNHDVLIHTMIDSSKTGYIVKSDLVKNFALLHPANSYLPSVILNDFWNLLDTDEDGIVS